MNDNVVVEIAIALSNETKKEISDELKKHKLIHQKFTGRVILNINQGGVTVVERFDSVK